MIKDPTMNYFAVYACSYNMFLYHVLISCSYIMFLYHVLITCSYISCIYLEISKKTTIAKQQDETMKIVNNFLETCFLTEGNKSCLPHPPLRL